MTIRGTKVIIKGNFRPEQHPCKPFDVNELVYIRLVIGISVDLLETSLLSGIGILTAIYIPTLSKRF